MNPADWPLPLALLINALAVFRISRLVATDDFPLIKSAREWLLRRWPSDDTEFFASEVETVDGGYEVRNTKTSVVPYEDRYIPVYPHWLGVLVSCIWCNSWWVALSVILIDYWWAGWRWIALGFAYSAIAGLLHR